MRIWKLIAAALAVCLLPVAALATVNVETNRVQYTCNGTTTAYTYPFKAYADSDLLAVTTNASGVATTLSLNTDYTVTGAGADAGGTLTLTAGGKCPSGSTLTILRDMALTQSTDYVDGEVFSASSLETALDRTMLILQQQQEELSRAVRLPAGTTTNGTLPAGARASKVVGFDSGGAPALLAFPSGGFSASQTPAPSTVPLAGADGKIDKGWRPTSVVTKTANYVATTDDDVILVDASAGAVTITMPDAATMKSSIVVKKIDASANTVTIDGYGSQTIDGALSVVLEAQGYASQLFPNGSNIVTGGSVGSWVPAGQCRLTKSGANLLLSQYNGKHLSIGARSYEIPAAGVALGAASLAVDTVYYIYAYMNGSTMTLEASTAAPVVYTSTGIKIKTGDASRTLVGMARTITGPAWQDTSGQRFVISYFNRQPIFANAAFTASRTVVSTSFVEPNGEIRNEFLTWGDFDAALVGAAANNIAGSIVYSAIGLDTTVQDGANYTYISAADYYTPVSVRATGTTTEGYHYTSMWGRVNANTGTWLGGSNPVRTVLRTRIDG